jgi:hypothetical protein
VASTNIRTIKEATNMQSTVRGTLRRGAAGSAAVLIAGASMWLSSAPTLAKSDRDASASHAQDHKSGADNSGKSNHTGPGDSNAGDVWLDNVGQPSGPGHEMDPHLACADINLWGDKLADASGTFTIDSWPPSGSKTRAYGSAPWDYEPSGPDIIAVIPVHTLIANAVASGAAPVNKNGYHFKLEFSQDPQKHKTFWVSCPPPVSSGPHTGGNGGTVNGTGGTGGTGAVNTPPTTATVPPASGVEAARTTTPPVAPATAATHSSPAAAAAQAAQGVLGAATSMPVTGRAAIGAGLLMAFALVAIGAIFVRRARTVR